MKVRYTKPALKSLESVLSYIDQHSPDGASRVQDRLQLLIGLIARHPKAGQETNRSGIRRLVATPYPYIILYRATENEIVIHAVRHASRKPTIIPA